ncbi:hypothetical protein ACFQ0K_03150 [Nocardioides caeni]|uniref:Uncharacterized protein n=1 Tax=Nocardioides caeni TaxID=574700 RepID=A0A4S8NMI5_9ACTN|nr:hypothetical protein [Nocardioides caeni]THV18193.1 hypothetical protein E9934_00645 [Nocardioides caeni]
MTTQHLDQQHCTDACRGTNPSRSVGRRRARLLLTGGLLATLMPMTSPLNGATTATAASAEGGEPAYGGFTVSSLSTPVRIEIFEPSLPIPVDAGIAQLEFNLGYSKVRADSGQSAGRASLFWPGDPVGEGLKTFAEQLGLPATPLTANGYPVQVNSQFPGDTPTQKDSMIPGSIQQTTSGDKTAIAEVGFSPDGAVLGPDAAEGDGAGGGADNPLSALTDQLQGLLGGLGGIAKAAESTPVNPLAALVDIDGYVSVSKMNAVDGPVVGASRSLLGEIRLLGGLVTIGGLETVAKVTTDGAKGTANGKAVWGKMAIAGQEFAMGPDGITATGQTLPIPGLKDLPADALEQLGITFSAPEPVKTVEGDQATAEFAGLKITIDTKILTPLLKALPTGVLAELIPAEAGPVKGVVAGLNALAPKIVLTLGYAKATADTVPPVEFPPPPSTGGSTSQQPPPAPAEGTVGVPTAVDGAPAPTGAAPPAAEAPVADLVDAAPVSAGLPALFSIPGMLLIAAFAAAAVAGGWMRRIGVAALGAGAPCTHGLDSGLPDLRKA